MLALVLLVSLPAPASAGPRMDKAIARIKALFARRTPPAAQPNVESEDAAKLRSATPATPAPVVAIKIEPAPAVAPMVEPAPAAAPKIEPAAPTFDEVLKAAAARVHQQYVGSPLEQHLTAQQQEQARIVTHNAQLKGALGLLLGNHEFSVALAKLFPVRGHEWSSIRRGVSLARNNRGSELFVKHDDRGLFLWVSLPFAGEFAEDQQRLFDVWDPYRRSSGPDTYGQRVELKELDKHVNGLRRAFPWLTERELQKTVSEWALNLQRDDIVFRRE
jgi:hypothetical protein